MQYFKPAGNTFAGDCMPFFHDGVLRLFYLVDEGHHSGLGGLGGHQWAQATTTDLIHWDHQPLALGITQDWEGSICTGSVLFHGGLYHAFYATRTRQWTELLSHAVSRDGIYFEKTLPNPLASPPAGYDPRHFRDPFAFFSQEDGRFHLLVTAQLSAPEFGGRGGCLAHLVSTDLLHWQFEQPLLIPGLSGAPECSDYFPWNGWYYLIFSNGGIARYRVSNQPFGPWQRMAGDVLDSPAARVMKTAAFGQQRRIGAAWIGTREGNRDEGRFQFGGNVLLRELVQHPDGSLGTGFAAEFTPRGANLAPPPIPLGSGASVAEGQMNLANWEGLALAKVNDAGRNFYLRVQVSPQPGALEFGLGLRAQDEIDRGYLVTFLPLEGIVRLGNQEISGVDGLGQWFTLEVVIMDDLIDVCVDGRRTLVNRCIERDGRNLFFFAQNAEVSFEIERLEVFARD